MEKVIVIVGPTGVGKTKMGVALAKYFNGEVISGDSMQIYKTMDIGTAKVTVDEMEGIKHHLIDIKEPTESYSVKDFQDEVRLKIKEISSRGKLPIIVGGTGLYIKAALYDYEFGESQMDHQEYINKYQDHTNEQLYDLLLKIDEVSAKELHPNNRQRVLRAIAIYESTGVKKSETLAKQNHELIYDARFIGLTLERDVLYERINQRVDLMMEQGLYQEIEKLMKKNYSSSLQSMKAIGYKEWFAYFQGNQSLEETLELIKKNSRNYAKRQYTWFNNQLPVKWFNVNLNDFDETINMVIDDLKTS
ncbi:tRNA (adenosine(37)-N6)-dimethylallyltransferase MiaA [Thomasclavelia saccharogumia]|uniref:tRNA (adenosine(37)-N6)-dimethylallyltransferase MiaA n=1 Tax=Thomasclavelia saccharogumia TaxID=341225 RepID=UPI00047AB84F|nr:tRNA (adenosine(37)-N6)-dimethylallyltransferase MiaA [Thomasclavelia saccharogumia]